VSSETGEAERLLEAFRGLDTSPGGVDDLRRTILNQREHILGAEAELATARSERARLEQENARLRRALHRAKRWPFGWVDSVRRLMAGIRRRISIIAS
jgi:hypothetical protein